MAHGLPVAADRGDVGRAESAAGQQLHHRFGKGPRQLAVRAGHKVQRILFGAGDAQDGFAQCPGDGPADLVEQLYPSAVNAHQGRVDGIDAGARHESDKQLGGAGA